MLNFAIDYKKAIEAMTSEWKSDLHQFELDEEEWAIAEELQDMLKILKDATLFFSCGTPSLLTVLPAIDHINSMFTDYTLPTSKTHPAVCAAVEINKKTLNKYYSLTDYLELYQIAMVLYPCHKLTYFKNASWDQMWIDTAKNLVHDQFESRYASCTDTAMENDRQKTQQKLKRRAQRPTLPRTSLTISHHSL
ncbi:hypothetical protein BJV74DRAFT_797816 [Russula compacta]|nr:hypothetical protein BJV74DRAFT_797816 [Russula compacta]